MKYPEKRSWQQENGKCNFTNLMQGESYYRCDTPAFVLHILEQFSAEDTIAFFRELGVMTRDRQGYCYPRSGQASAIRNALLRKAEKLGIEIHNGIGIRKIIRENNRFSFDTKSGSFFSTCCILATGGMASPKSGSDGSGYIYAKSFGHTVKKPLPALTALMAEANWLKETTGVRADATVKLYVDGSCVAEDTGEVQMADYGISGIPAFQVSRYAAVALDRKQCVTATLDFVPEYTEEQLRDFLKQQLDVASAEESWKMLLSGIVNEKIASMLCVQKHLGERKIASIPKAKKQTITEGVCRSAEAGQISDHRCTGLSVCTGHLWRDSCDGIDKADGIRACRGVIFCRRDRRCGRYVRRI